MKMNLIKLAKIASIAILPLATVGCLSGGGHVMSGGNGESNGGYLPSNPGPMSGFSGISGNPGPMNGSAAAPVSDGSPGISSTPGLASAQAAATATPTFGSVTQSSNQDEFGVSTDTATTTFSPGRLTLAIARQDGGTFLLDSAEHAKISENLDGATEFFPDRAASRATLLDINAVELNSATVLVLWSPSDDSEYLAGGYWFRATGDLFGEDIEIYEVFTGDAGTAEIGAFVDGTELRGTPDLPITGTAAYDGIVGGMYAAQAGNDTQIQAGTIEMGEFDGDIALTANFDTQDISGTVDNIYLNYTQFTPDGKSKIEESQTDYVMELGAAPFGSDGTFTGSDVTITHPELSVNTEGSWGGRFSTVDDSAGNPRVVAGTFGGAANTSGETEITFVGAFYGATDQIE